MIQDRLSGRKLVEHAVQDTEGILDNILPESWKQVPTDNRIPALGVAAGKPQDSRIRIKTRDMWQLEVQAYKRRSPLRSLSVGVLILVRTRVIVVVAAWIMNG
jgi:translation initiation factor IF-1